MGDYGAALATAEEQIADIVMDIRNGYKLKLEHAEGFICVSLGTDLSEDIADRLEKSIGIRKSQNEDGSVSIRKLEE